MTALIQRILQKAMLSSRLLNLVFIGLVLIALQAKPVSAQWTTTGTNTTTTNNVGIGTANPGAPLEVQQAASPTVPNLYLSQGSVLSKSVFQFIKPSATNTNTWSFFGHNVYYNGSANVLLDPSKNGWAFYFNGDVTDAFYIYSVPTTGGLGSYPLVLKRDGRFKLSSGDFVQPGNNQFEVQVQNSAYVGSVIKAAASQSANLQEWQSSSGNVLSKIDSSGNLSVGVTGTGNITAAGTITGGNIIAKYQDVAEWVPASAQIPAGTVVVLDSTKSNQVISSRQAYDTRVAGVVSAQPGIALGERGDNKVLVATTGRVRIKVDASQGPIQVGDLLVTSDKAGLAMKSQPLSLGGVQIHRPGTLIGKALEPLAKGEGEILVLLSLQ